MNNQSKKYLQQGAFTLIELLVVMVVLLSTGMVIGAILFSSLRGATKTSILTIARQNGDYAMSQMVKTIRNAKSFGGVGGTPLDNNCNPGKKNSLCAGQWIMDCSQGGTAIQYKYINITTPDSSQIVFSCANSRIASNDVPLTDDSLGSPILVDNASCYFTCLQSSPSESPTIGINFSIKQSKQGSLSEGNVSLPFSTSVKMRNSLR